MDAIASILFQFDPCINLCIAFAIMPIGGLLVIGLACEAIKTAMENRRRKRRTTR